MERSITLGVDYVEFDVHRLADGTYVIQHDHVVDVGGRNVALSELTLSQVREALPNVVLYTEVLGVLRGRAKGHVDLKFVSPPELFADPATTHEVEASQLALDIMGEGNFVITTGHEPSVLAVRQWADQRGLQLLVGLSLGRGVGGLPVLDLIRVRLSELFPTRRLEASRANLLVPHQRLAFLRLLSFAKRRNLPVLVWTVDGERELRSLLRDSRVWMLTTNFPARALALQADVERPPA
jgi:glycerophosphoryl diester phosphodiesterase